MNDKEILSKASSIMGKKRWKGVSKKDRSEHGKRAVSVRWEKNKEKKEEGVDKVVE